MILLENKLNAKVGDKVQLKGEAAKILKLTMLVYFVPFSFLLLGIFGGIKVFKDMGMANYEPMSFLLGIVGLVIGYGIVRLVDKSFGKKENTTVVMTKII